MCNQQIKDKTPCHALLQMMKEPKAKKSSETQTSLLGLIGCSFDSCEKRIFKLLKANSSDITDIIEKIEEEFGEIAEFQHKFIFNSALVSAVCRNCLNSNIGLDEVKFRFFCSLLSFYIEGNEYLELTAFLAIKLLQIQPRLLKLNYSQGKIYFNYMIYF